MEISTLKSLTEMGLDHSFLQQWQVGSYDEICPLSMGENYYDMQVSSIPMFNQEQPSSNLLENDFNRPLKQQNTNSWVGSSITEDLFNLKSPATATATADTHYLAKSNNIPDNESSLMKPKLEIDFSSVSINYPRDVNVIVCPGSVNSHGRGTKRARARDQAQAQDHVLAERKRREKLSQKFIALSALIPGLKRIDKASILGDTIKYLKQLQQRVTTLEEQTKNQTMECVVSVKNHPFPFPFPFPRDKHYISSSDEPKKEADTELITQIEAKFSGKDVLIKIYCQKRKNILNKVIAEIDKFPLSIINSTAMSFGSSAFDITIIAQVEMEEGFNMSINEFVKNLDFKIQSLIRNYNN